MRTESSETIGFKESVVKAGHRSNLKSWAARKPYRKAELAHRLRETLAASLPGS